MSKFQTKPPDRGKELCCQLRVLGRDDQRNYDVEIAILSSGPVQGGTWEFRNLEQHAHSFCGQPILCAYVDGRVGDGHNSTQKFDRSGERYQSFTGETAERIVGAISEKPEDVRVQTQGGRQWILARGKLWRFYAKELVDKIARKGRMDVSAEADVTEMTKEGEREIFHVWVGYGVTILGDGVAPAVPNAHIRALRAMEQEFKSAQLRAATLQKPKENKGVKQQMDKRKFTKMLRERFPDYEVLGFSEEGAHIVLMAKADGAVFTYQFAKEEPTDTIIPARIKSASLEASLSFEDGTEVKMDSTDIFAKLSLELETANRCLSESETKRSAAEESIRTMQERETARRMAAAEAAVNARFALVNANRTESEKMDRSIVAAVLAECKSGKFNSCADETGKWTGEAEAVLRLMAQVGEEQLKLDAQKAAKPQRYAWDSIKKGSEEPDDIEAVLASING